MQTVTVSRRVDGSPETVRALMDDVQRFMAAGGFDDVTVDGDVITLENTLGFANLSLTLERDRDADALAYEQRDGMFSEMRTEYEVVAVDGGTRVSATTEFELGNSVVADVMDATLIRRQRVRELEGQFDWLEAELSD